MLEDQARSVVMPNLYWANVGPEHLGILMGYFLTLFNLYRLYMTNFFKVSDDDRFSILQYAHKKFKIFWFEKKINEQIIPVFLIRCNIASIAITDFAFFFSGEPKEMKIFRL
jgi:hypothetical protein